MDHLYFGARARRKARRRQLVLGTWIAGLVAALLGVPGATVAAGLLHRSGRGPDLAGAMGSSLGAKTSDQAERIIPRPERQPATETRRLARPQPARTQRKARPQHHQVKARPAPTVSPTPTLVYSGSVTSVIDAAARVAGVSADYLVSVARCESGLDATAYNPSGYYGLFQFDRVTWEAFGNGSIYDPAAQSLAAARLLAAGETSRWPNCA